MTQHTGVVCTNTINSMVFAIRLWLLLETRLVFETWLLLDEIWYQILSKSDLFCKRYDKNILVCFWFTVSTAVPLQKQHYLG